MLLKIGTFNMASGLHPNLKDLGNFLQSGDFDCLGLQEVDENTTRFPFTTTESISQKLSLSGYFSKAMNFSNGHYGLSLFTKGTILQKEEKFFPIYGEEPRLFQHILVELQGTKFHLYNTHFSFETPEIRQKQMEFLSSQIETPSIITGDFNTDYSTLEWNNFQISLGKINGSPFFKDTFKTKDSTMHTKAIDNILYSKEFTAKKDNIIETSLSDHHLLTATLELS